MSDVDVDCRGLKCPEPVLRTRQALAAGGGIFTVLVDNEAAKVNVNRFARTSGCDVEVSAVEGGFLLTVKPGTGPEYSKETVVRCSSGTGTVVFVQADEVGSGDRELGVTLMKSFLYASTETDEIPSTVVLMNSGVRLATENAETIEHLKKLEERGVELLVCGTCLDFYGLKDKLGVGRVSNMYEICSVLFGADNLISL